MSDIGATFGSSFLERAMRRAEVLAQLKRSPAAPQLTAARQRAWDTQGKDEHLMARSLFIGAWWALDPNDIDPLPLVDAWMEGKEHL